MKIEILTKKLFMDLTDGMYIVSHISSSSRRSIFAEEVEPFPSRKKQWKRIVQAGFGNQKCRIFQSRDDCEVWCRGIYEKSWD